MNRELYRLSGVVEGRDGAITFVIPGKIKEEFDNLLNEVHSKYILNSLKNKNLMLFINLSTDPLEISLYREVPQEDNKTLRVPVFIIKSSDRAVSITTYSEGFQGLGIDKMLMFRVLNLSYRVFHLVNKNEKLFTLLFIIDELIDSAGLLTLFNTHPSITIELRRCDDGACYPVITDNNTNMTIHGGRGECFTFEVLGLIYKLLSKYSEELSQRRKD